MTSVLQDVRYALRMMARSPGLTTVLVVTLALGIAASTTIFSVVSSILLRPLPYREPDRLVRVYSEFIAQNKASRLDNFPLSVPELGELEEACRSCETVGALIEGQAALAGGDRAVFVKEGYANAALLPMLGVQPMLGRWFDASEDAYAPGTPGQIVGDPTVIVLGYDVWKRAFGADRGIIGKQAYIDAIPVTIIGVMPEGFDFFGQDVWVPSRVDLHTERRGSHMVRVFARLKPGVTIAQLRSELDALSAQWGKRDSKTFHSISTTKHPLRVRPLRDDVVGSISTTLWLLQGAVLLVLVISIVNIANLLLARAEARTREVAVRHALGANHRRLVRQFFTESVVLGLGGAVLGMIVSYWALDGVRALIPASAPRAAEISMDSQGALFAVGCGLAASLLFGLAPIIHARKSDLYAALKDGAGRMTGSGARLRVRRALVIGEVALAVLLVIGCTVMIRSFVRLQHVELGFDPDHVLTFGVQLPQKSYPDASAERLWTRLEERLRALPGVEASGIIGGMVPDRPINAESFVIFGQTRAPDAPEWNTDRLQQVGPGALEALRGRIVRGRGFTTGDVDGAPRVILVNEAFVAKFFPDRDPIGQQIDAFHRPDTPGKPATIVGVVADMKNAGVEAPAGTEIIYPRAQMATAMDPPNYALGGFGVIRTTGDPAVLIPTIYQIMKDIDPMVPLYEVRTMDDLLWEAVARPRFLAFLLSAFAVLALVLAAVGIYGVMAHTVQQRTHEIGLRVALGAQPAQVRVLVLRQAAQLVGIGIVVGLAAAIALQVALARSLSALFYGASLSQPALLAAVAIAVAGTALLATWIPVRRATRVQPTVALRSE